MPDSLGCRAYFDWGQGMDRSEFDRVGAIVGDLEEITDDISDVKVWDIPALFIFACLFAIVALQFFTRYVLNDSLGWTEEIARYFLIMLGFVGGVTCVRRGSHIFLEFAYRYFPQTLLKPISGFVDLLSTAFWGYAGILAIELAQKTRSNMVSIDLPKSVLYYVVSVACFCAAAVALWHLIVTLRKSPEQIIQEKRDLSTTGV
ncbi:TRAP-type C4-dicarboxylate transport system, small permease component [Epibacterium ulvae]|uniref:TRAP transporter small permease protein n=2 Tax=Epibacterium ulvae TaxID=1156985 RepID=A0A1G5QGW4_9RHOB|nr:TRAP transporter small permease [Epibacterium ulvae]SCZ60439.1 TRAP-type C4-dicarboxylate transport system, small permease component [Epibacterium ulvae]